MSSQHPTTYFHQGTRLLWYRWCWNWTTADRSWYKGSPGWGTQNLFLCALYQSLTTNIWYVWGVIPGFLLSSGAKVYRIGGSILRSRNWYRIAPTPFYSLCTQRRRSGSSQWKHSALAHVSIRSFCSTDCRFHCVGEKLHRRAIAASHSMETKYQSLHFQ